MVTRLSQYFLRTLREDPADAEVASHRLLVRAGYIRRAAPGIFTWLPLGLRVKAKIEKIIRDEMANAGAYEVHFPALLPREPYEQSGRWTSYGDGIFRLHDRRGADYLLENTEVVVAVHDGTPLYVELPVTMELVVEHTDPGLQGDRSTGGTKPATLETGAQIQVPLFISTGEKLKVDTRDGRYLGRAN